MKSTRNKKTHVCSVIVNIVLQYSLIAHYHLNIQLNQTQHQCLTNLLPFSTVEACRRWSHELHWVPMCATDAVSRYRFPSARRRENVSALFAVNNLADVL